MDSPFVRCRGRGRAEGRRRGQRGGEGGGEGEQARCITPALVSHWWRIGPQCAGTSWSAVCVACVCSVYVCVHVCATFGTTRSAASGLTESLMPRWIPSDRPCRLATRPQRPQPRAPRLHRPRPLVKRPQDPSR